MSKNDRTVKTDYRVLLTMMDNRVL